MEYWTFVIHGSPYGFFNPDHGDVCWHEDLAATQSSGPPLLDALTRNGEAVKLINLAHLLGHTDPAKSAGSYVRVRVGSEMVCLALGTFTGWVDIPENTVRPYQPNGSPETPLYIIGVGEVQIKDKVSQVVLFNLAQLLEPHMATIRKALH